MESLLDQIDRMTNSFHLGRGLDAKTVQPVGWEAHEEAIRVMRRSYAEIPAQQRIRLGKTTSNVFRARTTSTATLDVSGLRGVIAIDPVERTADVQGMCTYEDLVDATLPFGLSPTVVPQLKTITLGGAVTGMGVESTSFCQGLPHEAVEEMDIFTGTGDILTCSAHHNVDLFRSFPNSYGSLGYALRLKIHLVPISPVVELRHVRCHSSDKAANLLESIATTKSYQGLDVEFLDGVAFSPTEIYLSLGRGVAEGQPLSDYTRQRIYYRSLQHPTGILRDYLSIRDYFWRWDPDWFWCSRAFGVQHPRIRKLWPRDLLRSNIYWKLIDWDRKYNIADRLEARAGRPARERVVQDIEVTCDRLPEFLEWFFQASDIQPVWLCPIQLRDGVDDLIAQGTLTKESPHPWPLYPLDSRSLWVNVGFWSSVPVNLLGDDAGPGAFNRLIEHKVKDLGGHKSLYSESFYSESEFKELYGGDIPEKLKSIYDPQGRFLRLYEKTVGGS
nr:FAD-binding oxidoreductase [Corynebacterium poyangense]